MSDQSPNDENISSGDINISDIISKLTQSQAPQKSAQDSPDILSSLLSNPELISKLPQLISFVSPFLSGFLGGGQKESLKEPESAQASQTLPPQIKHTPHSDSRAALLCAIKPYLCSDRQAAVDYIIKLSRLGEILKTL